MPDTIHDLLVKAILSTGARPSADPAHVAAAQAVREALKQIPS